MQHFANHPQWINEINYFLNQNLWLTGPHIYRNSFCFSIKINEINCRQTSNMEQILHQTLVSAASQLEQQLDSQINQLDNLDTDDLQALRNQRLNELKELNKRKQEWLNNGHGQVWKNSFFFAFPFPLLHRCYNVNFPISAFRLVLYCISFSCENNTPMSGQDKSWVQKKCRASSVDDVVRPASY